jgi:ribosomal protein S18 acetylase RimI-like enzyme
MGPNEEGRRTPDPGDAGPGIPGDGRSGPDGPAEPPAIQIRTATDADAIAVATLHATQINQGFLAFLGPAFLRRLYRRIVRAPSSFLLVAHSQGTIVGFIAGSTDVAGLYRSFLLRDGIPAGLQAAGPLISGWRRVLETLRHGSSDGEGVGHGAEVLSMAVDPSCQGRGLGRTLMASYLDELRNRGCHAAHVVIGTVNTGAIALHEQAGFVTVDRFELHSGSESLLMQWEDQGPAGPAGAGPP